MKKMVPQKLKNIYHLCCAVVACFWFGFPSRKIKVIGVTGTNGKTTTVQMITKILEKAGKKVAMSSTINFKLGDKQWVNKSKFTTLSAWKVQKFIKDAVNAGCEYVVIETSSHSLDQNRVWGVDYDVAVITNVTREHLDYHVNIERYRQAKMLLFNRLNNNFQFSIFNFQSIFNLKFSKNRSKVVIVNLDMEKPEEFLDVEADEVYGYAVEAKSKKLKAKNHNEKLKTVVADNIFLGLDETEFKISGVYFRLNLIGQFNIENALAAVCVGLLQDINLDEMANALKEIKKVPGRMDYVENDLGLKIIIDYALTPDSMEKLGQLVNKMKQSGKVFWVFGSCGDRDRGKRPMMGEIVAKYADFAVVTNEDPYGEDPGQIINEVFSGVVGHNVKDDFTKSKILNSKSQINSKSEVLNSKQIQISSSKSQSSFFQVKNQKSKIENLNAWRIMDRREAIKKAIEMAKKGDIILVTGKGAEETMMIGDKMIAWNDRRVIEKILREIKG
jgi:UDP-N-acetylmuramoyl-L-alanyl-D-glutamate--2,6-diaminopimelate ligase